MTKETRSWGADKEYLIPHDRNDDDVGRDDLLRDMPGSIGLEDGSIIVTAAFQQIKGRVRS
jgi:uncharacterized protein YfeS